MAELNAGSTDPNSVPDQQNSVNSFTADVAPVPNQSAAPVASVPSVPFPQPAPDTSMPIASAVTAAAPVASAGYADIVKSIIGSQENIIGPLALQYAQRVGGLTVDWDTKTVTITGQPSVVIDALVGQYQNLFGQISVEVCKEAASRYLSQLPPADIPSSLR